MKRGEVKLCSFTIAIALMLSVILLPFSIAQNPVDGIKGTPIGWIDDINLSNDPTIRDNQPQIAVEGDNVHVVWIYNYRDVFYSKSNDNGQTWTSPISLFHCTTIVDWPYIGLSENMVHVVWSYGDSGTSRILYRNSTDYGETWNSQKEIFNSTSFDAYVCGLYVKNTNIHIISFDFRDGTNGEIYYRRSLDSGITFDNGQSLDADRRITYALTVKSKMSFGGDGSNLSIVWPDERDGDWETYWIISKDNGFSWEDGTGTPNVGRKISDTTTDGIYSMVASNGSNIHVAWVEESWPGPVYSLYYRNSTDSGLTWNTPQLLTGPWAGITEFGLDVEGNNVHLAWGDKRVDGVHSEIFYKNSSDGGTTWDDDLRLTYNLSTDSFHPKIAVENDTRHIVWYDRFPSNDREVFYKRYPDFPDTYPPTHTNEIPFPDSYKDAPGTNVSVHVTDPSGVNASTIQLWVNGSLVPHSSMPIVDGFNVSWVSGGFSPGVITCRIIAEDMLGNVLDYTWNFTVLANYFIPLSPGWNLISLPLEQIDTSPQTILGSIAGQYDVLKYYNALDKSDPWKTYRPGSTVNDLTDIDNTVGFWIHATQFCNLTVRGNIPTYTTIPLYAGWNLVGYPSQTTDTVANVLWGTGADRVEVFDPVSPYIKEVGPTYIMKPGEGYWVHVPADTTWVINW